MKKTEKNSKYSIEPFKSKADLDAAAKKLKELSDEIDEQYEILQMALEWWLTRAAAYEEKIDEIESGERDIDYESVKTFEKEVLGFMNKAGHEIETMDKIEALIFNFIDFKNKFLKYQKKFKKYQKKKV